MHAVFDFIIIYQLIEYWVFSNVDKRSRESLNDAGQSTRLCKINTRKHYLMQSTVHQHRLQS